jgi:DNA-binding response OmpR family regulator
MINRPAKILYVEDEASFASVVSFVLRDRYGHDVDVAETGEDGIERMKSNQYDLVFLDYLLPGINGVEVLQWMKDNKIDTPVVVLTAAGSEAVAVEAMKLGAYDYIRKEQLELDHLPVIIYNALENAYLKQENAKMMSRLHGHEEEVSKMFQDTVRTLSHYINNTLATLMLRTQVFQRKSERDFQAAVREKIKVFLEEILRDTRMIEAVMKSLMNVSNVTLVKYTEGQDIIDIRKELDKVLQELQ